MPRPNVWALSTLPKDLTAGLVVFLVALPLCMGVAVASNASPISGLIAGVIGGIVVGLISGSHTSVSGPAAGLTAVVAVQITTLGFPGFLAALVLAGGFQIGFGLLRLGFIAQYCPGGVIKGLLSAIGLILILKQIPHVLGRDDDPEGDESFVQPDKKNTLSELVETFGDILDGSAAHGAVLVGITSILFLAGWDRIKALKKSLVPAPLVVVLLGIALKYLLDSFGDGWHLNEPDKLTGQPKHLVNVPVANTLSDVAGFFTRPDFAALLKAPIWFAAVTLALVASLETLLNLEAVDKLDPKKRVSPPNRELIAQGVGNVTAGLLGALPVTSVIVRSSVNLNAGAETKRSAVLHGLLLVGCVLLLPRVLNTIPIAALAAILLMTGLKLINRKIVREMWDEGLNQFLPFAVTVLAIVFTDLLVGVLIGLGVSVVFILASNVRRPLRRVVEKHVGGEVTRLVLPNQVSFLNRGRLLTALDDIPRGSKVVIDARDTDYIDPDILALIREYDDETAPARGVEVDLVGFRERYNLEDRVTVVDYATREVQARFTPAAVLQLLTDGNERFRTGQPIARDPHRQLASAAAGQHPLAVVLSCIDSRTPIEIVFDLGLGDVFIARIAGNVTSEKVLGSMEFACAVAGAKLILVMGHTQCGAVKSAVDFFANGTTASAATGCRNLDAVVEEVQKALPDAVPPARVAAMTGDDRTAFVQTVAERNVLRTLGHIRQSSDTLRRLEEEGKIALVGAMYDIGTGEVQLLTQPPTAG